MSRTKWDPTSKAAQAGAERLNERSADPDSGLGASARATQRDERQEVEAMAPFASRERARTLPKPKSWGEHLAFWRERGAEVLCGVLASPQGHEALFILVRKTGEEPHWFQCGGGTKVSAEDLEHYAGSEWAEKHPLESEWK